MKLFIIFSIIVLSIFLFKKAAGTLKPNFLNIISFVFYSIMLFEIIGGTLVYFGFADHYMIKKIVNNDTIEKTYYCLLYTILALPLCIILFNKLLLRKKIKNVNEIYVDKLKEKVDISLKNHSDGVFCSILLLSIISLAAIVYVFYNIGYVPFFKFFDFDFDFNVQRILVSRHFSGNVYIKNLVMLIIPPLISYISYIYMRVTRKYKWKKMFVFTFILAVFALTYNFEKGPVIYYFFYFLIIEIMLGKMFDFKKILPFILGCGVLIIVLCKVVMGYNGNLLSLSTGPLSRILVSQVSSLFLHFDAFGNSVEFLNGGSFPPIFDIIFDASKYDVRSGAIVMSLYGGAAITNGTAGVLNTLFIGEAYANFGYIGVALAPILSAFIFSLIFCFFLKSKKTPLNMVLYLQLISVFIGVLQGGLIDFIYNIKTLVIIVVIVCIKKFADVYASAKTKQDILCASISKKKRCIYHVPNYIEQTGSSGSSVRPMKMLNAFRELGYEVDFVMGYKTERKRQIKYIKKNIRKGIKYEFMYSESSTMPTLLTEKNHLPNLSNIDFRFMKYCKDNDINIGLYYRDIYWRFPEYGKNLNFIKKYFAIFMYKYDLYQYSKILDILYLQSNEMAKYLPKKYQTMNIKVLPPGCEIDQEFLKQKKKYFEKNKNNYINVFYVGGIGDLYDLTPLLKSVSKNENVRLTVCCREKEWLNEQHRYKKYINDRVKVVHESGKALDKYYKDADICSLYFPEEEYRNFVMPIKLYEYMSKVIPIISTKNTQTGLFVEKNDIGWQLEPGSNKLDKLFENIVNDRNILIQKHLNMLNVIEDNTWLSRAKQVEEELSKIHECRGNSV